MLGSVIQKPKEVEGWQLICEECNEDFGLTFFEYIVDQKLCKTCNDGDEPCHECGVSPSQDMTVKFMCRKCQIEKNVVVKGESV